MKSRLATSIRCSFLHMNPGGRILVSTLLAVMVTAAAGAQSAAAVSRSAPWAIKILSCAPTPLLLATIFTNGSGCEKGSERNKNRVHDAKNRRVRARAQSQGKHRHDGKTGTPPKQPQSIPQVLK
jgi:hypothetical protein